MQIKYLLLILLAAFLTACGSHKENAMVVDKATLLGNYYIQLKYGNELLFYKTADESIYKKFSVGENVNINTDDKIVYSINK